MKIIKNGRETKHTRTFKCKHCGCVFEADTSECRIIGVEWKSVEYYINCPCCNAETASRKNGL